MRKTEISKTDERKASTRQRRTLAYLFLQKLVAPVLSRGLFQCRVLQNALKSVKGPYLVLANHECALDAANLLRVCNEQTTVVISSAFYHTLPFPGLLRRVKFIHKQQFQTQPSDLRQMREVVAQGRPLALYPAGLMSEDGRSTPIPRGTARFIRWLDVDVYAAVSVGTYMVNPKWSKKLRPGRTTLSVTPLFRREEFSQLSDAEIDRRMQEALAFDAYRAQEKMQVAYRGGDNVKGLEQVLYRCPRCGRKYTIEAKNRSGLVCRSCGYSTISDKYGFLHCIGEEKETVFRYVSDWSAWILRKCREELGETFTLTFPCEIHMLNRKARRFESIGQGALVLTERGTALSGGSIVGTLHQKAMAFPYLPFQPGKFVDYQYGGTTYRCFPKDGNTVTEIVHTVHAIYTRAAEVKI